MSALQIILAEEFEIKPNGSAAAAILAAGIGSMLLGIITVAVDKNPSIKSLLSIYKPAGPLSGVTTTAILGWLICWLVLELLWRKKDVSLARINVIAFALLVFSLLATFPPIGDLL